MSETDALAELQAAILMVESALSRVRAESSMSRARIEQAHASSVLEDSNPVFAELLMAPPALTVEEAAAFLGIGRSAAYEAIKTGQIRSFKVGRSIRVPRTAIIEMLA